MGNEERGVVIGGGIGLVALALILVTGFCGITDARLPLLPARPTVGLSGVSPLMPPDIDLGTLTVIPATDGRYPCYRGITGEWTVC